MERIKGRDPVLSALVVAIVLYYVFTKGIFQGKASGDGYFGFMYLPGLLFHHSLDLRATVPDLAGYYLVPSGQAANPCPIGPVLLWAPLYGAGILLQHAAAWLLALHPRLLSGALLPLAWPGGAHPGQREVDFFIAGLGSLLAGLGGIALLYRMLRRHAGTGAARFGVLGAVLATPLLWYLVTQPLYQHACAFFTVTLLCERWDAWRNTTTPMTPSRFVALGALSGLAMLMRVQEGIWLLLPGLDLLSRALSAARRRRPAEVARCIGHGVILLTTAALVFAPQALLWRHDYGALRPPQGPGHMRWSDPALIETIFSMRAGLLPWSPVLYMVVPGLILGRRRLGGLAGPLSLMLFIELWVNAAAWDYHGSWAFGARRFTDATVGFAAGLAGLWAWAHGGLSPRAHVIRPALAVALVFFIAWNGLLMELVRSRRIKSSAAGAFPASVWVRWASGPPWLGRVFDRVGYPFAQPAGWLYALVYRVKVTTFEGVVGNYLLERDWKVRSYVLRPGFSFTDEQWYVVPSAPGTARVLVPLLVREPVRLLLDGEFAGHERDIELFWNGTRLPTSVAPKSVSADVPESLTHSRIRTNVLQIRNLSSGSRLRRLDLRSRTEWWAPPREIR